MSENLDLSELDPQTWVAQAMGYVDEFSGGVVPPIYPSTTYVRDEDYDLVSGRLYSRADNPNYELAEKVVAKLEGGADAVLVASGNAAGVAVFQALNPGARVLVPKVMYWALRGWLMDQAVRWGLVVEEVDMTDLAEVEVALARGKTDLVWLESPANPNMDVTDIAAVVKLAHAVGARVGVDSTFATPVHTRPLLLGADLVMHSATKYLNGHSDVVAGVVVTRVCDEYWQELKRGRFQIGHVLGPFEAWLLLRGMRTLFLRVRVQSANALELARRLEADARVERVLYPGLPSFAGYEVAKRQMVDGFGGMLSVCVKGDGAKALAVAGRLKLWKRATSLGGVESLVEHRASVEGPLTRSPVNLLRLSVGIESVEDLWRDLDEALGVG